MINVSSNLALFGLFNSFTATSKACIGMVWTLRVHEVDSTLGMTWPYLCTFSKNMLAILAQVFNTVFINPDICIIIFLKEKRTKNTM